MAEQPKPGSIVHVEFHVKEPKKVEKFYGSLGARAQAWPSCGGTMRGLHQDGALAGQGAIEPPASPLAQGPHNSWVLEAAPVPSLDL